MNHSTTIAMDLVFTPALSTLIELALEEDLGRGDLTTAGIVDLRHIASSRIICREPIICCGLSVAGWVIEQARAPLVFNAQASEGQNLAAGAILATLDGPAEWILRLERTVLNFLQRLCGVATLTNRYVHELHGTTARVVDTRKTIPGWRYLDKYAVRVGGGANHRHDLGSGILVKDNHIAACGSVSEAVHRARLAAPHLLKIEVEVESLAQAQEALAAGAEVLLLDNMTPAQVAEVAKIVGSRALLEVSGGITLQTIRAYVEAGASIISVGALTHSAPAVDLSLEY